MTVKHGGQGTDSVGIVSRCVKKGRHAAGWCGALCVPTVGAAYDNGPHSREVWQLRIDQASGGCRLACRPWSKLCQKHGSHRGSALEFPVSSGAATLASRASQLDLMTFFLILQFKNLDISAVE
jgi:hypothetical protein